MPFYLLQRGSTLYFRIKVPDDVRHVIQCTEIKTSLQTGYRSVAKPKALLMAGLCQEAFSKIRAGITISPTEINNTFHAIINPSSLDSTALPLRIEGQTDSPSILTALRKYLADSETHLGERSFASYKAILHEFAELVGESVQTSELSHAIIRRYKDSIQLLPKNRNKKKAYRGKTIQELLRIKVPESDKMSRRTLNMRMVVVKGFFKGAVPDN